MINFSIVIPHKNTPQLLARALESIPSRSDLEVIIVDDNSDTSVVDTAKFPEHSENQTIIIWDKSSKGAGHARNIGLQRAQGHWIFFMDADDVFSNEIHQIFNKYVNVHDIDMVFLNADVFDENNIHTGLSLNRYIKNALRHRRYAIDILRYGFWAPWSRMMKRELLIKHDVKFEEVKTGNDIVGILTASLYAKTFAVEDMIAYHYYKPSYGSQTKLAYSERTALERLEQRFFVNKIYEQAKYKFRWPIRNFIPKDCKDKTRLNNILKGNKYNPISDLFTSGKYYIAKALRML